jgi:hypothetical protein
MVAQPRRPSRPTTLRMPGLVVGSLDQNDEQVDDAPYHVVEEGTVRLSPEFGEETYRYLIAGANKLALEPVIPPRAKREALAKPLEFSLAGHMAAVAYAVHTWTRVDCARWCWRQLL